MAEEMTQNEAQGMAKKVGDMVQLPSEEQQKKITSLTEEQKARIPSWVEEWVHKALHSPLVSKERQIQITRNVLRDVLNRTDWETVNVITTDSPMAAWKEVCRTQQLSEQESKEFIWPAIDGHWSASYFAWVEFLRYIGVQDIPKPYETYKETMDIGLMYPLEDVVIICDKPTEVNLNSAGQLHKDFGPAVAYADSWCLFSLNGVVLSKEIVMTKPEEMTAEWLQKYFVQETNAEVRREIVRKLGHELLCQRLGAKEVDKWQNYTLLMLDVGNQSRPYLKMLNPSVGTYHVEGVGVECRTVRDALEFRKPPAMKAIPVDEVNGEDWFQQGDVYVWSREAKFLKSMPSKLT